MSLRYKQHAPQDPYLGIINPNALGGAAKYISEFWVSKGTNLANIGPNSRMGDTSHVNSSIFTRAVVGPQGMSPKGSLVHTGLSSHVATGAGSNVGHVPLRDTLNPITQHLQHWTAYGIFRLTDYSGGTGDSRVFAKDINASENGHTFMFGMTSPQADTGRARCRIGFTGGTGGRADETLYATSGAPYLMDNDGVYMIAVTYDGAILACHILNDLGDHASDTSITHAGEDITNNNDPSKIGKTAGVDDNPLYGNIFNIGFFDGAVLTDEQLEDLFTDYKRVLFTPPSLIIPFSIPEAGGGSAIVPITMNQRIRNA